MGFFESPNGHGGSSVSLRTPGEDTVRLIRPPEAVGRVIARTLPPWHPDSGIAADGEPSQQTWLRRQLRHDIRHELATIMLLASLLESAPDVGPDSQQRARQILGETRWLDQLQQAYDETFSGRAEVSVLAPELIRLDLFAAEVVGAIRLSTSTRIGLTADETWAHADRLAFWRALRNMVGNAVRAAGPEGHVEVRIESVAGWAVAQVDDDGPGFGAGASGTESLGLDIVRQFTAAGDRYLEIRRNCLGGCCALLRMRAAEPGSRAER